MRRILLLFLLFFSFLRSQDRFLNPDLRLTLWDVGQGDSILLQFPGGKTMLVDAGGGFGEFNIGSRFLLRELTRRSILTIDAAVMTHPDQDHAFGFLGLFPYLKFKEIWVNRYFEKEPKRLFRNLVQQSHFFNIPFRYFDQGTKLLWEGVAIELVALGNKSRKTNEHGLVLKISRGHCHILLTADIEKEGEQEWLRHFASPITVLKVAHHGSKTSTLPQFLAATRPQLALISVGPNNRYGHPHPTVIQRLRSYGATTLRTDTDGAIELSVRDHQITYHTFTGVTGTVVCR